MLTVSVLICVAGHTCIYMYTHTWYIPVFVCVPVGNTFSAVLWVGPGGVELRHHCLSQAAGSGSSKLNPLNLCPLLTQSGRHRENIPPVALRAQILHLFP